MSAWRLPLPITDTCSRMGASRSRVQPPNCADGAKSSNPISGRRPARSAAAIVCCGTLRTRSARMAELAVEHLSLQFGGLAVLTDVSLHVEAGELLALIGPNGAGKTSVLNCISGIYRGQGAIRLRGDDINGRP